jgi:hypothetical protein
LCDSTYLPAFPVFRGKKMCRKYGTLITSSAFTIRTISFTSFPFKNRGLYYIHEEEKHENKVIKEFWEDAHSVTVIHHNVCLSMQYSTNMKLFQNR